MSMFERLGHNHGEPLSSIGFEGDTEVASAMHKKVAKVVSPKTGNSIYGKGKYRGVGKEAAIVPKATEYGAVVGYTNKLGQTVIGQAYTFKEGSGFQSLGYYLPTGDGIADVLDADGNFVQKQGGKEPIPGTETPDAQSPMDKQAAGYTPPPAEFSIPSPNKPVQQTLPQSVTPVLPQSVSKETIPGVEDMFKSFLSPNVTTPTTPAPDEVLPEIPVAFDTIVGTIRGTYTEIIEHEKYIILLFDADKSTHFTPAANGETAIKLSGGDTEQHVYFVGIEFVIPSLKRGVQVFIKE